MSKPRLISFYLPQFYPTPENDEWWGKGFTEWTNVGRAKPQFFHHHQPRVPSELGYYDLRLPEVRVQQAKLAKEAGIEGFCYWHYWFGNGKRLLDRVFSEVVDSGAPDYPFCLCWANHSWYAKTWEPNKPAKLLIEQTYPGVEDYKAHFYAMLPAFMDKRYMKVNGRLIFGFFAPLHMPDVEVFMETWNELAKENGLEGFYFFAYVNNMSKIEEISLKKFDHLTIDPFLYIARGKYSAIKNIAKWIYRNWFKQPYICRYSTYVSKMNDFIGSNNKVSPCLLPNYDHSPRSGKKAVLFHNSTPELWVKLLKATFDKRQNITDEENILFIKAWNEWGEGNYLEPELKFGDSYIRKMRQLIDTYKY